MLARRKVVTETAFRRPHAYDWLIGLDALFSTGWRYVDDAIVHHRIHDANQSNGAAIRRARTEAEMTLTQRWFRHARRLSPRRKGVVRRGERRRFVQRLEHLSFSPVVPQPLRRDFARLWDACTTSWYRGGLLVPGGDQRLRSLMLDLLKPYAASESDWDQSVRHIERLT